MHDRQRDSEHRVKSASCTLSGHAVRLRLRVPSCLACRLLFLNGTEQSYHCRTVPHAPVLAIES